jgi:hypothetical protein
MRTFKIQKKTGTYAELLEAYGVANLLNSIMDIDNAISITSNEQVYEVSLKEELSDETLNQIKYFHIFKYIKPSFNGDDKKKVEEKRQQFEHHLKNLKLSNKEYYDCQAQSAWRLDWKEAKEKASKEHAGKDLEREISRIKKAFSPQRVIEQDLEQIVVQIAGHNNFTSFDLLYRNFIVNKDYFSLFINEILKHYTETDYEIKEFDKKVENLGLAFDKHEEFECEEIDKKEKSLTLPFRKDPKATQLYNPSQGKGIKKTKANGLNNGENVKSSWISETMKISGAFSDMICQPVRVGKSYDLKVFVPEYKEVNYKWKLNLTQEFRKRLRGQTPIKIDILNTLLLTKLIIEHQEDKGRRVRVKNIVSGLHSVYQKDLGQTRAVINIGFLQIPGFIEIGSKEENAEWIDILKEQQRIIGGIKEIGRDKSEKESGKTIPGLLLYRNFLSGDDIYSFFKFAHWYSTYAFTELADKDNKTNKGNKADKDKKKKVRVFSIESLDKLYKSMDTNNELNLKEITSNVGFQAVAEAIRRSTVSLQKQPKKDRIYNIRYGVSQTLQTKSKSKDDLAEFLGEFIARYNAETAREAEKSAAFFAAEYARATNKTKKDAVKAARKAHIEKQRQQDVSADDLEEFYTLLDKFSSRLVGALLASYGFAMPKAEASSYDADLDWEEEDDEDDEVVEVDEEDEDQDD